MLRRLPTKAVTAVFTLLPFPVSLALQTVAVPMRTRNASGKLSSLTQTLPETRLAITGGDVDNPFYGRRVGGGG